jgi:hypothetical protein
MPDYRLPKRAQRPEWEGASFAVIVLDGNSNEWFLYNGSGRPFRWRRGTPKQFVAVENALQQALDGWRARRPRGPAATVSPIR